MYTVAVIISLPRLTPEFHLPEAFVKSFLRISRTPLTGLFQLHASSSHKAIAFIGTPLLVKRTMGVRLNVFYAPFHKQRTVVATPGARRADRLLSLRTEMDQ